jgi:hypothetical protein
MLIPAVVLPGRAAPAGLHPSTEPQIRAIVSQHNSEDIRRKGWDYYGEPRAIQCKSIYKRSLGGLWEIASAKRNPYRR